MYRGQYVAIFDEGIDAASNLVTACGGVKEAANRCSRWWLGRVKAMIVSEGVEVELPHFSALVAELQKKKAANKKGQRKRKREEEDADPRVVKCKVEWYGTKDRSGVVSCKSGGVSGSSIAFHEMHYCMRRGSRMMSSLRLVLHD